MECMHRLNILSVPLHNKTPQYQNAAIPTPTTSFSAHLQEATKQDLKISKHANERIIQREISISAEEWQKIESHVSEARGKGVKQPLVLMDQAALIINATNRTVITAMDRREAKEQIFTNIDGTILL